MATIKEIAEAVGVSSAVVSRVLNYDEGISVSANTREAIFKTAEKMGYKKKVIYPKIENVALLFWVKDEDELEDIYYKGIRDEVVRQAKRMHIELEIYTKDQGLSELPDDLSAFVVIGWMNRKEINELYKKCKNGVFIGTSPDEKLFDAVRPNLDSFVTQIVDYFMEKKYETIGFIGITDWNVDTEENSMDIREWSFRQSAMYYGKLEERYIFITNKCTVSDGYEIMKKAISEGNVPSAFCIGCDTLAVGALQALNEAGYSIPNQVAIFSINDINIARYVSPPLTTFHIDIPIICETALELLRGKVINGGKITKSVFVNGTAVFRKSC